MAIGVNAANGDNGTTVTGGPYKVGDYYNDGTKEGIVFEVYDGGWHGKIVSLNYSEEQWAVDAVCRNATGATSETGGMNNMNRIKKLPNWKENYPAFAWCASLGSGWYLPAIIEVWHMGTIVNGGSRIAARREVRKRYNQLLKDCGGKPLSGIMYYQASTESTNPKNSTFSHCSPDEPHTGEGAKSDKLYVRAFYRF